MTPREFHDVQLAWVEEQDQVKRDLLTAAWLTAAFAAQAWSGKLPDLRDVLNRVQRPGLSPSERRAHFMNQMSAAGRHMKSLSKAGKRAMQKLKAQHA